MAVRTGRASRRRRALLLAAAATIVVAATGCSSGSKSATHPATSTTAGGATTVYTVEGAGFSIAVPKDWQGVDSEAGDAELKKMAKDNPAFQSFVDAVESGNVGIKFIAVAPKAVEQFKANVNVVAEAVPSGTSMDEVIEGNLSGIEAAFGVRPESSTVSLPAGQSGRLVWATDDAGGRVERLQYFFLDGTTVYTVTFTSTEAMGNAYDAVFQQSAESFRLL